jgi:hypothetical protein
MTDKFRVFGTQFDPSVVQALLRQERTRDASEMNRMKAASKRAKAAERRRARAAKTFQQN